MKQRIFNSSLYLILTYFLVHVVYGVSQYVILSLFDLKNVKLGFFYNTYIAPADNWWTRFNIIFIFGIGFFFVLLIAFYSILRKINYSKGKHKLNIFYNWLFIVSFAFLIAEFFAIPFFSRYANMYHIFSWFYFNEGGSALFIIGVLSTLLVPPVAYFSYKRFLKMVNSKKYISSKNQRLTLYLKLSIIPLLVLSTLLYIGIYLVYEYSIMLALSREGLRLMFIFIILVFGAFFSYNKKFIELHKQNSTHLIDYSFSFLIIVVILAYFILTFIN